MERRCRKHDFPIRKACPQCHPAKPVVVINSRGWQKFLLLLASHPVEEYVSPKGYRMKKITRCGMCDTVCMKE